MLSSAQNGMRARFPTGSWDHQSCGRHQKVEKPWSYVGNIFSTDRRPSPWNLRRRNSGGGAGGRALRTAVTRLRLTRYGAHSSVQAPLCASSICTMCGSTALWTWPTSGRRNTTAVRQRLRAFAKGTDLTSTHLWSGTSSKWLLELEKLDMM